MAEENAKPKRRLVKKAETVREKVEKATESDRQPRRLQATRRQASAPFRFVGRGLRRLNKFKPFRIIGLILVPPYFRNSWRELRRVTWPGFRLSLRLTFAVTVFAIIFGCVIAGLDWVLDKLFKEVILK